MLRCSPYDAPVQIRTVRYRHPDAALLTDRVQREYAERYGSADATAMREEDFDPPGGRFLVGYTAGVPVVSGGWRARDASEEGFLDGDAELKRMYVVPQARGRGWARAILAALEADAAAAGRIRMVLETGQRQPEAIGLYTSCGYVLVPKFGVYRDSPLSICLGRPLPASAPDLESAQARSAARS